jgi:hypothetical protein
VSFAELKRKSITTPERVFTHISDKYTLPEGWVNEDLPEHRIYKNPLFPEDQFFSATTMLGKIAKMKGEDEWLKEWRLRIGDEAADAISLEATTRGTAMHDYLEKYISNQPIVNKHHGAYMLFQKLKPWCDERIDAVIASEHALYSRLLRIAGRVDLVAILDGLRRKLADGTVLIGNDGIETLVDFKSSRRIKTHSEIGSYYRQVTMYAMMFEETTGVRLDLGEIWMSCWDDGRCVPLKFEVILYNYKETVIDELAEYWAKNGDPYRSIKEIKDFFL